MRLVVYGAVLAITLGNVLLGLDWLSAPMAPMVNTEAGLRAPAALLPPAAKTGASDLAAPVVVPPTAPNAKSGAPNIGARIIPPGLTAPTTSNVPTSVGTEVQTTPPEPIAVPEPQVTCNVEACTAAYRSFKASDCTYLPTGGTRRLCAK